MRFFVSEIEKTHGMQRLMKDNFVVNVSNHSSKTFHECISFHFQKDNEAIKTKKNVLYDLILSHQRINSFYVPEKQKNERLKVDFV